MAKQKKVTVNGEEYTLQSVSPTWYFGVNDDCGMDRRWTPGHHQVH